VLVWIRDNVPAEDSMAFLPGEDPVYFALGRRPPLPSVYFFDVASPLPPREIARHARDIGLRWVFVKRRLQLYEEPPEVRELVPLLTDGSCVSPVSAPMTCTGDRSLGRIDLPGPDGLDGLDEMVAELASAPPVFHPSRFWRELGREHIAQLRRNGFSSFKRTVNTRYFNWRIAGILAHQLGVVAAWARRPDLQVFRARMPRPAPAGAGSRARFDPVAAWIYRTFVAMYWEVLARHDPLRLLSLLEEPELGDPFLVLHRDRRISQDLCNSVHELYSIVGDEASPLRSETAFEILEIGAGYGRLAHVFLAAAPNVRYTIVDVPPALAVSQAYLSTIFAGERLFRFRPFSSFDEIADEFLDARIRFLLPHQAEQVPSRSVDQVVNISSFHEMARDQVQRYFALVDRICRGRMYTKQWRVSRASIDGVVLREHDYPVPPQWRVLYHERHPIQRWFFHALYQVAPQVPRRGPTAAD
jgi:putative sugar O-methyltransferase